MKTLEQAIERGSKCIDRRDLLRLCDFMTLDEIKENGFWMSQHYIHNQLEFTRENILKQLKEDVSFGFEKALNKRGLSSSSMYHVVKMWNWVLQEGLEDFNDDNYAEYGLPIFKATALLYGFDNPIGEDSGSEYRYSYESDEEWDAT